MIEYVVADIHAQDSEGMLLLLVDELLKLDETTLALDHAPLQPGSDQKAAATKSKLSSALDALTAPMTTHAASKAYWVVVSSLSRQPLGKYMSSSSRAISYIPPCILDVRVPAVFDALFGSMPMAYMPAVQEAIYDTGGYPKFLNACMVRLKKDCSVGERVVAAEMVTACKEVNVDISLSEKLVFLALAGKRFAYDKEEDFGFPKATTLATLSGIGVLCNSLQTEGTFVPFIPPFLLHSFCSYNLDGTPLAGLVKRVFSLRTNFHPALFEEFHMLMDAIKRVALNQLLELKWDRTKPLQGMAEFYSGIVMKTSVAKRFAIDLTLPVTVHPQLTAHLSELGGLEGIDRPGVHYFLCAPNQPGFDLVIVQRRSGGRLQVQLVETKHSASDAETALNLNDIKAKLKLAEAEIESWEKTAKGTFWRRKSFEWMLLMVPWRHVTEPALGQLPAKVAVLPKEKLEHFYTPSMLFKGMFYRSMSGEIDVDVPVHGNGATPRGKTSHALSRQTLVDAKMEALKLS